MRLLLTSVATLTLLGGSLAAQAPGDSVRLTLVSGERVTGGFVDRSASNWRLDVAPTDPRLVPVMDVQRAERRVVRERSRLKSQSMWWGMLTGVGAMYVVYATEIRSETGGLENLLILPLGAAGAVGGGAIGYVVGASRPLVVWREVR